MFVSLELCNEPRNSFGTLVILGVLTLGISILLWYIYLKCQSNEADKGTYVCEVALDMSYMCMHTYMYVQFVTYLRMFHVYVRISRFGI